MTGDAAEPEYASPVTAQPGKAVKESGSDLGPLPGGHHGLTREQVSESQRERLLAAVVEVVAAKGYRGATITEIVGVASVSSRAFYENFEGKDEAFIDAFDALVSHLEALAGDAAKGQGSNWPLQIISAIRAALDFFSEDPAFARFCLIEPATATPEIVAHFRDVVLRGVPFLEAGRSVRPEGAKLPASTEDSLMGGLVTLVSAAVSKGEQQLTSLAPDLIEFVLAPYLGAADARRLASEASPG